MVTILLVIIFILITQFDIFLKKNCLHYSCAFYFTSMVAPLLKWGTKRFFYTWSSKGHTARWLIWLITVQKLWRVHTILNLTAKKQKESISNLKTKNNSLKKIAFRSTILTPMSQSIAIINWTAVQGPLWAAACTF